MAYRRPGFVAQQAWLYKAVARTSWAPTEDAKPLTYTLSSQRFPANDLGFQFLGPRSRLAPMAWSSHLQARALII